MLQKSPSIVGTTRQTRNRILNLLPSEDLVELARRLEPFSFPERTIVEQPGEPIDHVYFPDTGFISVVAGANPRQSLEVAMVGSEGMTGVAILLGDDRAAHQAYTQAFTTGWRVPATVLRELCETSAATSGLTRRYALAFLAQITQTALANGHARIDQRLARWLLMVMDRMSAADLPLTHDLMAVMLGVRRPGVTDALHRLEGDHLIRARRGLVSILDRDGLVARSGGCYGVAEAEYARLIG